MKLFATVLLCALAMPVAAQDIEVWGTVMTRSVHMNRQKDYNEANTGFGLEVAKGDFRANIGRFSNSYYKDSTIAGVSWLPLKAGKVVLGGQVGVVSGYPMYDYSYGPYVLGVAEYKFNDWLGADFLVIFPSKLKEPSGAVALQLKARFY